LNTANSNSTQIVGLFPELLGIGGIQEAGRLTAAALQSFVTENGGTTTFLSLNDSPGQKSLGVGGHAISLRGFGRAKARFVFSAIGVARAASGHPGVVLAAHPNLAPPARWMRRANSRLKTIVMCHGIEVWEPLPSSRRSALAHADLVLAPSADTAKKIADVQGVPKAKIRKLAWPLHPGFLRLADAADKLLLPATFPKGRTILAVGRWVASERYKGADELIRALAQLGGACAGWNLAIVGGGDDLPRLRQIAATLNTCCPVHFLENLSREEIAACYAGADLFALPSTGEGFGLVYLEAMAFGKAAIGAACGGTTDVVEDGVNGLLVPPRDANALANALRKLLENEALRQELGRRGAQIVREKYQFALFQSELQEIVTECLRQEA
jgi:phosphatidyl-myo-inositol dimannoside synthase